MQANVRRKKKGLEPRESRANLPPCLSIRTSTTPQPCLPLLPSQNPKTSCISQPQRRVAQHACGDYRFPQPKLPSHSRARGTSSPSPPTKASPKIEHRDVTLKTAGRKQYPEIGRGIYNFSGTLLSVGFCPSPCPAFPRRPHAGSKWGPHRNPAWHARKAVCGCSAWLLDLGGAWARTWAW